MDYLVIAFSLACLLVCIGGLISRDMDIKTIPNMYKSTLVLWNLFAVLAFPTMFICIYLIARELWK